MKTLFLVMLTVSSSALAAQLAVVSGSLKLDPFGDALIYGRFTHYPDHCSLQLSGTRVDGAAKVSKEFFRSLRACDQAIMTLDLTNSTFCSVPNERGAYRMPKLIAVQCQ